MKIVREKCLNMKIFISADIEGITTTTFWEETDPSRAEYKEYAQQMTKEVIAACEGANAAGASEIIVRDAHGDGNNIDIHQLPSNVKIIRGWSGHPYSMVYGIDSTFDAVIFIGYHSAASRCGNPLSHTESLRSLYVKINGRIASEFMLYSYAALLENVPTVFLAGDKMLCNDYADLHPNLITCPVKEGVGASTINYNPKETLNSIKVEVERALKQDLKGSLCPLPTDFELEICYKDHTKAERYSYFPGVKKKNDNTLIFRTNDYFELLSVFNFIN
jgi:D-amino peptidase